MISQVLRSPSVNAKAALESPPSRSYGRHCAAAIGSRSFEQYHGSVTLRIEVRGCACIRIIRKKDKLIHQDLDLEEKIG